MCPPVPLRSRSGIAPDLDIANWASDLGLANRQRLGIDTGPRPARVAKTAATGQALVSNGQLGADIIRLAAGDGFAPHTHPGDHLLLVLAGEGTITYRGAVHPTRAGQIYLIAGAEPHAVGAITDHVILAVGSPHRAIDAPDRMVLVAYEAVTADFDRLHCLICDLQAVLPARLHDAGCPHCPCGSCHPA
jgi:quercetin dioxygenase-like cupin family protein